MAGQRVRMMLMSDIAFDDFDAAATRDNLGRVYEMKGDVTKAKFWREKQPDRILCSHFNVSFSLPAVLILDFTM